LQAHLFASPRTPETAVALFSGGLDSLAGLGRDLQAGRPLVLVSGATTGRISSVQANLLSAVATSLHRALPSVIVPFSLIAAPTPGERSQRSRGFMFLVLGFATAITAGLRQLRVYENGVGAINLPYLESQVGTHSTRAMHPLTLDKAEHL